MRAFVAVISPVPYWTLVALAGATCVVLCAAARRHRGPWTIAVARVLGVVLITVAVVDAGRHLVSAQWSMSTSLPLALCDVTVLVTGAACWWRRPLLVELTYYWGVAGALQGLLSPDLNVAFPHVEFFEFVVAHSVIVLAALFLVVGLGIEPRAGSVTRATIITYVYSAVVALVDVSVGANYMFLRREPREWTFLRLLGPWPWYIVSCVIIVPLVFLVLYAPFAWVRHDRRDVTHSLDAPARE
jgi:hypothetical integral membrane protein (TIGR02206 family)